jgi:hypothetical protein
MSDELLRCAENLADELEEVLRVSPCGTEEEEERLTLLLAAFRREQEHQVCQRAIANCSPRNGTAAVANPKLGNPRKRAEKGKAR